MEVPTKGMHNLFCHINDKENGDCEAVEFFEPADVIFRGKTLIGIHYDAYPIEWRV
jgi:hypothetical protein